MKKILVADIGGTNSRFAIFQAKGERLRLEGDIWFKTNDFRSFEDLLAHLRDYDRSFSLARFPVLVFAVPGPVIPGRPIRMSKVEWPIDMGIYWQAHPESSVYFINDFVAQAFGCVTEISTQAKCIKKGTLGDHPDCAVVGSGTGLGHGALIHDNGRRVALASEAGHTAFALIDPDEVEYGRFLVRRTGCRYPTSDQVVSGPGLSLLHEFITDDKLLPYEVAAAITPESETTRWFSRFLGRCCRNYCVSVLPCGGKLFVSGGLAAKNPFLVDNDVFREEFINSPLKASLLHDMPIYLNGNESMALWGAARYGQNLCPCGI